MTTWDNTQQGQNLRQAFGRLLTAYNTTIPGHKAQMNTAANRPIGG